MRNTYFVCVCVRACVRACVALVIRYVMRHIVICGLTALQYFSTSSHKRHDFRKKKKVTGHKMCVLISSTTLV